MGRQNLKISSTRWMKIEISFTGRRNLFLSTHQTKFVYFVLLEDETSKFHLLSRRNLNFVSQADDRDLFLKLPDLEYYSVITVKNCIKKIKNSRKLQPFVCTQICQKGKLFFLRGRKENLILILRQTHDDMKHSVSPVNLQRVQKTRMRVFTRVKYRSGVNMLDLCVEYVHHAYICYCSLFEKKKKVAHNK